MAKQHIPVDINGFSVRNGIRVQYLVSGIENSDHPWVHGIPSLKAAVAIAKTYPDVYGDGSATHITRRLDKLAPPEIGRAHV